MHISCAPCGRKKLWAAFVCAAALWMAICEPLSFASAPDKAADQDAGKQVVVSYSFVPPSVEVVSGRARLNIPGLPLFVQEGKPIVPFKTARILLPPSGAIERVRVTPSERKVLPGRFELERGQAPQPTRSPAQVGISGASSGAEQDGLFPGSLYELACVQKLRGYRIAILRLYPVQYEPSTGQVSYYETLTVRLSLSSIAGLTAKPAGSGMFRGYSPDEAKVRRFVDNPAALKTYPRPDGDRWQSVSILQGKQSALQTEKPASCQYLIITQASYFQYFQPLLDWKTQKGLTGRIAAVEEIKDAYDGADLQEKIRSFISECYTNFGTEYVLLGGDTHIIPHRGAYGEVGSYIDSYIPSDLYYACLDGNWDHDDDRIYGEFGDGEDGGEVDLIAEVCVGRAPVSSPYEAQNFVSKTLQYEIHRSPNLSDALWVGEALDSKTWGCDSKEELVVLLPETFELTRLYEKDGTYSEAGVIEALNASPHIVNHLGHSTDQMVLGLSKSDVDGLTNEFPFLLYSQGCDAGAFDSDDCIAEHFVKNETGAFAVVANSRYGWYSPESTLGTSQVFDREFLDAIFNKGVTNLGKALQESKEVNIGDVLQTGSTRWCYFDLNLLGDPETPLFTATSEGLLKFDSPQYSPRTPLKLSIADIDLNANPLVTEQAAITLRSPKDAEAVFAQETTSNSGLFVIEVPLSMDSPLLDGVLQVEDGDRVEAIYEDADDGTGVPKTVTAIAAIDASPPTVSNVKVVDLRDSWAVIEWQTNEPATARVDYGISSPFSSSAFSDVVTNTHRVVVSGLEEETSYRFNAAAIDVVGNETVDDNSGQHYSFWTRRRVLIFSDDVEEGSPSAQGQWSFEVVSGGVSAWQITTSDFKSGTACWHSDDYGSPSANALDTPLIDLRGMTKAHLSFWHRMLAETDWDGGFVQVQREDTQDWCSLMQEQMVEGTPLVTLSTGNPSGPVPGWSGNIPWERATFDLADFVGDRIRVRFRMESDDNTDVGEGDGWYIDDIMVVRAMGTVNLDKLFYRLGDTIIITVLAPSANIYPEAAESVLVDISSTLESVPEIVTLTETEPNSSIFVGQIPTAKGKKENDGRLAIANNDTITVSYSGAEPATAIADLSSPTISGVQSTQVTDSSAIIKWQTDEESRGAVYCGTDLTQLSRVASEPTRTAVHQLTLTDLTPRTVYYFRVESIDRAGNTAVDDNGGKFFKFLTLGFAQGGIILEDTVWEYVDGHPYVVNGSLYVGTGEDLRPVTLTIEPGVVVQFKTDKRDMVIRGGIIARGVTFEFDLPSGRVAHMIFEEGASGIIDNSVISVLGSSGELAGGIECYSSNIVFTNNIVRNAYYGFHCMSSSPKISGNTFIVCNYGVFLHAAAGSYSSPEITNNEFLNCDYPIFSEERTHPVMSGNVFDGNTYDGLVRGPLTEDAVWPAYDCPQYLVGDLAVPAGKTLSISRGATVRFAQPGADVFVSGNLYAEGVTIEFAVPAEPRTSLTFASTSSGSVRNCRLVGKAPDGARTGGIKCQSSAVSLTGNVITNTYYGVFCGPSKSPLIANNTIVDCEFGIYAPDAMPRIINCILWDNGDDLVGCTGTFLDTMDGDLGEGNISLDPLFRDPAAGDFRLQPGSPCIDSGATEAASLLDAGGYLRLDDPDTPNTGGGPRPYFDIGAYEFVVDADADSISDQWEAEHWFNASDAADALQDADGDGESNLQEYLAGTDPRDSSSFFRVTTLSPILQENGGVLITWPTVAGRTYTVFYAEMLSPPCGRKGPFSGQADAALPDLTMWKPCAEAIGGTGKFMSFLDAGDPTRKAPVDPLVSARFYRVDVR